MWISKTLVNFGFTNDAVFFPIAPSRDQVVVHAYVNRRLGIPTGKKTLSRRIDSDLQGYKFGDFAPTRRAILKPASRPKLNRSGKKKTGKK